MSLAHTEGDGVVLCGELIARAAVLGEVHTAVDVEGIEGVSDLACGGIVRLDVGRILLEVVLQSVLCGVEDTDIGNVEVVALGGITREEVHTGVGDQTVGDGGHTGLRL